MAWFSTDRSKRGFHGKPLAEYTVEDIRREYRTVKGCAPRCTVACVHQVSTIDFWRGKQDLQSEQMMGDQPERLVQLQ